MILPEAPSETELGPQGEKHVAEADKENRALKHRPDASDGARAARGLGLRRGSVDPPSKERPDASRRRHSSVASCADADEDPNTLLGIIRELVAETKEWDASLFMDANFKSMIQDAELSGDDTNNSSGSEPGHSLGESEPSAEVDLGELGIELLRRVECPDSSARDECALDMISFWEDEGWLEEMNRR